MAHLVPGLQAPGPQAPPHNPPLCPQCQAKTDGLKEVMLWLSNYMGQNRCPHQGHVPGQVSCPFLSMLREKNNEAYGRYHP